MVLVVFVAPDIITATSNNQISHTRYCSCSLAWLLTSLNKRTLTQPACIVFQGSLLSVLQNISALQVPEMLCPHPLDSFAFQQYYEIYDAVLFLVHLFVCFFRSRHFNYLCKIKLLF